MPFGRVRGMGAAAGAAGAGPAQESAPSGERADGELGCEHYRRRCKLVAPCCGEVFWCRHCHNEAKNERETDAKKAHQVDRTAVQEVVCGCCGERQPVAASCRACSVTFGEYFCEPCRFYDNDTSKATEVHYIVVTLHRKYTRLMTLRMCGRASSIAWGAVSAAWASGKTISTATRASRVSPCP